METQCKHLTMTQNNEFLKLLQKYKELFDGTLGTWKTYPVLKVHEIFFRKEVECLVLLGVPKVAVAQVLWRYHADSAKVPV